MKQNCRVVLANITQNKDVDRVFDSKNAMFTWLNSNLVRLANNRYVHEVFVRIESYDSKPDDGDLSGVLPF